MESGDRSELIRFLENRDAPCPGCGYNLRGLTGTTCPECNQAIELRIALSEPRIGAYLGAVCGLLVGGGMAAVMLGIFVVVSMFEGWPPRRYWFAMFGITGIAIGTLLGLGAMLLMGRGRKWFRRRGPTGRSWVIAGSWGLTAAFVTWFLVVVLQF